MPPRANRKARPAAPWEGANQKPLVLALLVQVHWSTAQVLQLGSQRELFVDHYLIERMAGVELRLHEPRREGDARPHFSQSPFSVP